MTIKNKYKRNIRNLKWRKKPNVRIHACVRALLCNTLHFCHNAPAAVGWHASTSRALSPNEIRLVHKRSCRVPVDTTNNQSNKQTSQTTQSPEACMDSDKRNHSLQACLDSDEGKHKVDMEYSKQLRLIRVSNSDYNAS